jgi:hypothetical protein
MRKSDQVSTDKQRRIRSAVRRSPTQVIQSRRNAGKSLVLFLTSFSLHQRLADRGCGGYATPRKTRNESSRSDQNSFDTKEEMIEYSSVASIAGEKSWKT